MSHFYLIKRLFLHFSLMLIVFNNLLHLSASPTENNLSAGDLTYMLLTKNKCLSSVQEKGPFSACQVKFQVVDRSDPTLNTLTEHTLRLPPLAGLMTPDMCETFCERFKNAWEKTPIEHLTEVKNQMKKSETSGPTNSTPLLGSYSGFLDPSEGFAAFAKALDT